MKRVLLALSFVLLTGCPGFGDEVPIAVETPTYDVDVKPILDANCVVCHTEPPIGGAPQGIRLDQYSDDGAIQGAFSQAERIRVRAVQGSPSFMPPGTQLSAQDQATLDNWANTGALEN